MRLGAERGFDEIFVAQGMIESQALVVVLRGEGTAADQITRVAQSGVGGDAFPEQEHGGRVAVILVDAGAA